MIDAIEDDSSRLLDALIEDSPFKIGDLVTIKQLEMDEKWQIIGFSLSQNKDTLRASLMCKHLHTYCHVGGLAF